MLGIKASHELTGKGHEVSFWGARSHIIESGDSHTGTIVTCMELSTLRGWIIWHVSYISIKFLLKNGAALSGYPLKETSGIPTSPKYKNYVPSDFNMQAEQLKYQKIFSVKNLIDLNNIKTLVGVAKKKENILCLVKEMGGERYHARRKHK